MKWLLFAVGTAMMIGSAVTWGDWEGRLIMIINAFSRRDIWVAIRLLTVSQVLYFGGFLLCMTGAYQVFGRVEPLFVVLAVTAGLWEFGGLIAAVFVSSSRPVLTPRSLLALAAVALGIVSISIGIHALRGDWNLE